jgi:DNA-binding beta-propeller fold protein YncE
LHGGTTTHVLTAFVAIALWACLGSAPADADPFLVAVGSPGGSFALPGAEGIAVSPDGMQVYVAGTNDLVVFSRDGATGALVMLQTLTAGVGGVDGIAGRSKLIISPDGAHVYVSGELDDAIAVFARDAATGLLSFGGLVRDGVGGADGLGQPAGLAMSDDGAFLYVTAVGEASVAAFARDTATGMLTLVDLERNGANGVSGMTAPRGLAVGPGGAQVYVMAHGPRVVHFDRDPIDGSLTFRSALTIALDSFFADALPLAVLPGGTRILAGASHFTSLFDLRRNPRTGALTLSGGLSVGFVARPRYIVVHPAGGAVYFGSAWTGRGELLGRDPRSGRLVPVDRIASGGSMGAALSPDARHVYFTGGSSVVAFAATCTPLVHQTRVSLRRTISDPVPDDDVLAMKGKALLVPAHAGTLDPAATGAQLTVITGAGAIVDATLPGGPYGGSGTAGWRTNTAGTGWTFIDKSDTPANGVRSVKMRVRSIDAATSEVQVNVKGRHGSYPWQPGDGAVDAMLELGADHCLATGFRAFFTSASCPASSTSISCP